MWFDEPYQFPERGSPTRLSKSDNQVKKGDHVDYEGDWLNGDLELGRLWYSTLDKTYARSGAKNTGFHWQ